MMKVYLKCFSTLADSDSCDFRQATQYELNSGQTIADLLDQAQIKPGDVKIAFVNSKIVETGTILADGDRVGLAPAVGGM